MVPSLILTFAPRGRPKRFRISVKTLTGVSVIEHVCMRSETVDDLKAKVYVELGIPPNEQRLLSGGVDGVPLEDGEPLLGERAPSICRPDLLLVVDR
jgi:hypothetical protein